MTVSKVLPIGLIVLCVIIGIAVSLQRRADHPAKSNTVDSTEASAASGPTVRYLALGDSYTIGESVAESDRWPNQMVARLEQDGLSIGIVGNPSVTGYTTKNLIDRELPLLKSTKPNFVTVQIGVNDYVQGVSIDTFKTNLNYILDTVAAALPNPKQIVLVTIPDYGKTPTGARYGAPAESEQGIKQFNTVISAAAQTRGLPLADVFTVSQQVTTDKSLIAVDGLHPSGKQYTLWTDIIYPFAKPLLTP